jgi:cytochrome c oxidase subunit 2
MPVWALAVLMAAALALAGCGGGGEGQEGGGATPTPTEAAGAGLQVWNAQGCGSCHMLAAANATGQTGPNLDEALKGKSTAFIRKSIVDPNAEIAQGFSADVMPKDFAQKLSDDELQQLVDFIAKSTGS